MLYNYCMKSLDYLLQEEMQYYKEPPCPKFNEANKSKNGGVVKSDLSGKELTKPLKSTSGVKPGNNEWQIDHIKPRSKGGTNSNSNAQVLSRQENRIKWDN